MYFCEQLILYEKYFSLKMIFVKQLLSVIIVILSFTSAFSQMRIPYEYKNLTIKNGLPSDQVHHIFQDSHKYIWFCTTQGVSRFDGRHFENFGITEGLADTEILFCSEDNQARVWFYAFNGRLSYFDLKANKIYSYRDFPYLKEANLFTFISNIIEDKNKNIWVQGERSLKRITPDKKVHDYKNKLLSNIEFIFLGDDNNMYFLMELNNIYTYNFDTQQFEFAYKIPNSRLLKSRIHVFKGQLYYEHLAGVSVWSPLFGEKSLLKFDELGEKLTLNRLTVDSSHNLWFGTPKNTLVWTPKEVSKTITFEHIKNTTTVLTDHEGNTWIASLESGAFLLPKNFQYIKHYDKNTVGKGEILALAKDEKRDYIFFSSIQNALYIIKPNGVLTKIPLLGHSQIPVKKIYIREEHLWLQVNNNKIFLQYNFFKNKKLPPEIVLEKVLDRGIVNPFEGREVFENFNSIILPTKNMFFAKDGSTYFLSKGLTKTRLLPMPRTFMVDFCKIEHASTNRVYAIDEDEKGMIWYGGMSGLSMYDIKNEIVINFDSLTFETSINDIICLGNQTNLVSTTGNGLYLMQHGKITAHWNENNGLGSNVCNRLYKQDDKRIWVATSHGAVLFSFDNQDFTKPNILIYGGRDNQTSQMVNDILVHHDQLFLATKDGLYQFPLQKNEQYPQIPPIIKVVEPQIFATNADTTLHLSARWLNYDNQIKFRFQTIAFLNGEEVKYLYELYRNGTLHRSDSAKVHEDFYLPLLALPSGNYELRIKSKSFNQAISAPLYLHFYVPRPYLMTPWAILVYILLTGYITYRIFDFLNKNKKIRETQDFALKEEKLRHEQIVNNARRQLIELEQENIRGKIDPHFIFNALNGLMSYVYSKNYEGIKTYLPRLARLIRRSLELSKKEWITVEEEINYLEDYLALEKMRYEELFDYQIYTYCILIKDEMVIVPLLLQIFVENSIRHGFAPNNDAQKGLLEVIFEKLMLPTEGGEQRQFIRCMVRDNGVGLPETPHTHTSEHRSMGIQLVKKRIDLINEIHQKKYEVSLTKRQDGISGVEAVLLIPVFYNGS